MLQKLICYVWGHKIVVKAFTGRTTRITDKMTMLDMDVPMYKWEKQKYCLRCGKENQ